MNTTIIAFVWRGEEALVKPQLEHLYKVFPESRIHLVDDDSDPLPSTLVEYLKTQPRVAYTRSTFPRNKTLNGGECIQGELDAMAEACAKDGNGDGILIKIDLDTIVLRPESILQAFEKGIRWFSHTSDCGLFAGMFYAMKVDVLTAVREQAKRMIWANDPALVPEDNVIGALCYIECVRSKFWHVNLKEGNNAMLIGAFDVLAQGDEALYKKSIEAAAKSMIVTVGNTSLYGLPPAYRVRFLLDILKQFYTPGEELQSPDKINIDTK